LHGWLTAIVRRIPLVSGSRLVFVPVADDDVILRPPPPPAHAVDTQAAVRDALRYPLDGPSLARLAPRGGRVTVVVEPPVLPVPAATQDPRSEALATVLRELERSGVRSERITLVLAGGLGRRAPVRLLERLLPRPSARAFRGRIVVHDAERPELVEIGEVAGRSVRVEPTLVETDLVVVVSAAETVLHGGAGTLLSACDARTVRRTAGADSLLQASGSPEWGLALRVEAALAGRAPLLGVSLALDHPRLGGAFAGYPHDESVDDTVRRSLLRRVFGHLPPGLRRRILRDLTRQTATTAVYAGRPSVAHTEALLRALEQRAARVPEPFDALVLGAPWTDLQFPAEPLNPVTVAATALGLALRLWRDAFPVRAGGTIVLAHSLRRSFAHGAHDPYRALFASLPAAEPGALEDAERRAEADDRLLAAYRDGRTCHPLRPFADWAGCTAALRRVGEVVVAGCRDSAAARALGFVPSHSLSSALEMAHGLAGGHARLGVLVGPPYPPLVVGG
jgi:hypothetical protein